MNLSARRIHPAFKSGAWAVVAAAAAGVAVRWFMLETLSPREFSYMIESCFRFRYAEMRMRGEEPPAVDKLGQWPEGFPVKDMILPLPDRVTAAYYRLQGGDTFLASRRVIIVLSVVGVVAFVPLAFAALRRASATAAATGIYAVTFGAYARSPGNYLREDFAWPGLLLTTAAVTFILTGKGRGRALAWAAVAAAGSYWASACWHMSQFYLTVVAAGIVVFGLADGLRRAAVAGGGIWVGLVAAAVTNRPLLVKGAAWNLGSALALAAACAWLTARLVRVESPSLLRILLLLFTGVLGGASLAAGRSQDYGHVFGLILAKLTHFGIRPEPAELPPEVRLFWTGPYLSPDKMQILMLWGVLVIPFIVGAVYWGIDLRRGKIDKRAGWLVFGATGMFIVLFLLMSRLSLFLAPWVAVMAAYAACRQGVGRGVRRWAFVLGVVGLTAFHLYATWATYRPTWYKKTVERIFKPEPMVLWYYGTETNQLMGWFAREAKPGAILTDFAISPPFLYHLGRPIALNPMFEVASARRKAVVYSAAAVADEDTFYNLCRRWGVAYVIHFAPAVLDTGNGTFYNATGKFPPRGSAAYLMQFYPERLRRFRLVYETYSARVFEVGAPYDGYRPLTYHPAFDRRRFQRIPSRGELLKFYAEVARAHEFYYQGMEKEAARNFPAAVAAYTQALRLHPDLEDAEFRLGVCELALGPAARAEGSATLRHYAATHPDDPRPFAVLGAPPVTAW